MLKKLYEITWKLFGQYRVFIIPVIFFIIATVFYNIGEVVYSNTGGDSVGFFGITSRIIYLGILIYTVIKIVFAWRNQIKEMRENAKNRNK